MMTMKKKLFSCLTALIFCLLIPMAPVHGDTLEEVNSLIASIPEDWPEAPRISAKAAVLMDADSGEILYAKKATDRMYPASTTKLMTALLTLEHASLSDVVTFSQTSVLIPPGSSHIGMRRGDQMVLRECLLGLLLPSANEVANALAEHTAGTIGYFTTLMNEKALALGAVNTVFRNVNGLHEEGHYTCCYDLALIMRELSTNNTFTELAGTPSYVHHADDLLPKDIPMMNTNQMIRPATEYYNDTVVCGKTGHTEESGYNLVTYAEKDGVHLIAVVMGCESGQEYVSTQSLLDYGFNYFHLVLPAQLDVSLNMENAFTSSPLRIPTKTENLVYIDENDSILLPDNVSFDMLQKNVEDLEDGKKITYTYQDYPLGNVTLKYGKNRELDAIYRTEEAQDYAREAYPLFTIDAWFVGALVLMILLFVILTLTLAKRRKTGNVTRLKL